jgi:hypothetical protein
MPFDVATEIETPAQRRARLIAALRAPLPVGFKWDFTDISYETECGTAGCALGLAALMWPDRAEMLLDGTLINDGQIAEFLDIPTKDVERIFYLFYLYDCDNSDVTPAMVVDALEAAGG